MIKIAVGAGVGIWWFYLFYLTIKQMEKINNLKYYEKTKAIVKDIRIKDKKIFFYAIYKYKNIYFGTTTFSLNTKKSRYEIILAKKIKVNDEIVIYFNKKRPHISSYLGSRQHSNVKKILNLLFASILISVIFIY